MKHGSCAFASKRANVCVCAPVSACVTDSRLCCRVNEPHAFSDPLMASFADATSGDAKESFAFDATAPKASTSDVAAVSPTLHAIASKKGAVALALAPDPNAALLAQLAAMQAKLDAVEKKAVADAEPAWKDAKDRKSVV